MSEASQEDVAVAAAYARAERLLAGNAERLVVGGEVIPRFLPGCDRFWFREPTFDGHCFMLVDPERPLIEEAFDHADVAAALTAASGQRCGPERLPFSAIDLDADSRTLSFGFAGAQWRYEQQSGCCERLEGLAVDQAWSVSPDGRWAIAFAGHDLLLLDRRTGSQRQITSDGSAERPYGARLDWRALERRLRSVVSAPLVAWSPDSSAFVVERIDQSQVERTHLLEELSDAPRPRLHTFRDALPADAHLALCELLLVSIETGAITPVSIPPAPMGLLGLIDAKRVWWSSDSSRLEVLVQNRDCREARLFTVDPATGAALCVAQERGETMIDPGPLLTERPCSRVLGGGRGAVWFSERDGWGHLWLVDGASWRQLTQGEWVVRELLRVDEQNEEILFTASGREPDGGPYDRRLYRVGLAGGEPRLLTPEPLDHEITLSPSGRWLVDCCSSTDIPPRTVLRRPDGGIALEIARSDVSRLHETSWRAPERFTVVAADGQTTLHGLLYLPSSFDVRRSWPLLDAIYPGPQIVHAAQRFGLTTSQCEAFAELGVVVMVLDAHGTPLRSKTFHDASYRNLQTTEGLRDHVCAIGQLSARYPWIDVQRVGIVGHSGGGYATVRALLEHPDVFKVGISSVGNHDNRRYHAGWGERYIGLAADAPQAWEQQANPPLAASLRGKLMLGLAEMDANVHPSNTRALIAALVAADIDHDVVVIPNGDHWLLDNPYFVRRMWDYLVTHLIGGVPPRYRIARSSLAPPQFEA
ncbi:MAG TPA: DPP IV N-terminal domain-containing protein [Solirubrobacteraceae bacterium]|nr:DPP IV N-terminal domain-containing protein [Solirubrobacteraceae bacterium]